MLRKIILILPIFCTLFVYAQDEKYTISVCTTSNLENALACKKNKAVADLSDEDVTKILLKTQKSLKETISLSGDQKSKDELTIIEEYLPKEMTRDEVEAKIKEVVGDGPVNIGLVMKAFAGLPVDRTLVSKICQELQNK